MHTQKPTLPQNPLAPLAKPYTSMSIYTPLVAAGIISTAACWVPRSCNKSRVHTGLGVHLPSCARAANSCHNLLCARQGGERSGCCFLFVALELIHVHLNKTSSFNPVCMIKSYPVHTMQGRFLSFQSPNLMSETEETCYFGCE